jgi:polyhydroxyalkanoate synthesis regulator phasin
MAQQSDTAEAGDQQRRSVNPLDLVVMTRARLQEVVDEAVARGRLTRGDAADLVSDLVARGRSGAAELEQLIARRPLEAARRVAGLGQELPIEGYDDLTAAEVVAQLDGLSARDLRRVREYERANANRKTVLGAADRRLA